MTTPPQNRTRFQLHPLVRRLIIAVGILSLVFPIYLGSLAIDTIVPLPPGDGDTVTTGRAASFKQVGDGKKLAALDYSPIKYIDPVAAIPIKGFVPHGEAVQIWSRCSDRPAGCVPTVESPDLVVSTFYDQLADRPTNVVLQGVIARVPGGEVHCALPKDFGVESLGLLPEVYATLNPALTDRQGHQWADQNGRIWTCLLVP